MQRIFIILIFILTTGILYSQTNSTYNFLKLDVDARSSAMAGTYTSAENDVNTIFYNPAGLATIGTPQASVGFFKYLLDINSGNAAYTRKIKEYGYFGAGVRFFNYGSFDKYDEESNNLGTFSANDIAVTFGYANKYKGNFSYGISLKFIYSSIDEYKSTAAAFDLGAMYQVPEQKLNFGISILNIGTQLSTYAGTREKLPLDLQVGFNKKMEYLPLTFYFAVSNLTADAEKFIDRFKSIRIGGEFILTDNVFLRIGYNNQQRQDLKTGSSTGISGFSAGLGVSFLDNYRIDYAFNSLGKIGALHRFNLGFVLK
jgi:long-subunit fatty acid transport protein